jgi:hypothetical protein
MAAPNIVNVTSIIGKTEGVGLTTTTTTGILTCGSNNLLKINSIIASGISTSVSNVTISFYDSNKISSYSIAKNINIPAGASLVIVGKDSPIYLEESDEIRAGASAVSGIDLIISYDQISQ